MSPNIYWIVMYIITAVVMLFQLRTLLQSSGADYYHPFSQAVTKLTNPLVNVPVWRNVRAGHFWLAGFIVALVVALVAWLVIGLFMLQIPIFFSLLGGVFLFTKSLGYLIICLLLAQALCSWLPATREWSFLFAQTTAPITAPVQRLIPPIGMIDISLMVVLIAIYALNSLIYKLFSVLSYDLMMLWRIV